MPHISKNVWCQARYTQKHHQEERERILGGVVFCVFSLHLQLKQPLKIPIKTSHTERQLFLCCQRWWEYNIFMKLKIRADLSFYKGKGWESRLASMNRRVHPASDRHVSIRQKGGEIERFQRIPGKDYFACSSQGFIRYYGKRRSAVAKAAVGLGYQNPLQIQPRLADPLQLQVFWEDPGKS